MRPRWPAISQSFASDDEGAIVVEFSLVLPIMLLVLALTVESARMAWSYQSVIAGVRDAARYLARMTPLEICTTGGSVAASGTLLKQIVERDLDGTALFSSRVTVNSVTPSYTCVSGSYRVNPVPVGTVSANITIHFPMGNVLSLFGNGLSSVTTDVTDTSRIFGQ